MLPLGHMSAATLHDPVWKALADPNRREILEMLRAKPRTTGELCGNFQGLSRFAVMKHIRLLERAALLTSKRNGRFRWNYLNPSPLRRLGTGWLDQYR